MALTDRLNCEEKKAFDELQLRMKGALPPKLCEDTSLFYRFLKARDFDVDKAEEMLRNHLIWRKTYQIDTLLEDFKPREFFFKYAEPTRLGFGKDGEILLYCATGKLEISDVLKCVTINDYMKCWMWFNETNLKLLREQSEKTGKECTQMTFIIDLANLTLSNAADTRNAEIWLRLVHLFQDNYPERMKAVYVINAPYYYYIIFKILKVVMSGAMLQKIHIFSENSYKEALLDIIDPDLLPAFLGGKKTDPDGDPLCMTFVSHAGRIPSTYYLQREDRYFKNKSEVKKIAVPKNGKEEICIDVTDDRSLIRWEILVKGGKDIELGLVLKVSEGNDKEILPIERYSTSDGIESGSYKCQSIGKYAIVLENSRSWLNSREIEYCITVIKPE